MNSEYEQYLKEAESRLSGKHEVNLFSSEKQRTLGSRFLDLLQNNPLVEEYNVKHYANFSNVSLNRCSFLLLGFSFFQDDIVIESVYPRKNYHVKTDYTDQEIIEIIESFIQESNKWFLDFIENPSLA